ncbi:MAG: peptidylprolyl isomerase [Alteromonadaceae bacterium]|uniref:FKBP-type peptidyl-prolyl cis-trans isomerase n=1 Tax=unclassified Marinobacter TaxID=83889 RepID=UPI000C645BD9|nr:peptidylprolyl isomerase [Marinobacter sp. BGYM27]MAA64729.1 peptidylprolyl isomerase [Alteromonadaceae bacterium]MBH84567.1 peptidylprolyl isomerase [Alteromonadaceae bacterium]MDG5498237.1 peptidylprolyl isomerase [Marinobacter sp. BGYM27]|tara:strand:+ start:1497 stop:1958 length:462 start_codon:yes stop_codon:yes gene_type:complete
MERSSVYTVHYRLKNRAGEVVDASDGGEPLCFLQGAGNVIQGIEEAVRNRGIGDCLEVTVPAEMAYGEPDPALIRKVPRSAFAEVEDLKPGMKFQTNSGDEAQVVQVVSIDGNLVKVDANHPLAGFTLYFDLEIVDKRPATDDEIAEGRPLQI